MIETKDQSQTSSSQHPAHQGEEAIKHWIPDQQWYSSTVCASVVNLSKLLLGRLNHLSFEGRERWDALFSEGARIDREGVKRGLLSFSNHVSLFDDPLLVSNLGETAFEQVRWIAADHINFFGNRLKGVLYSCGKCVPIIRGGGLKQPGFDFLIERLKLGDWVHLFPEGGRSREEDHRLQLPLKVGIGKLICEAQPVLMPFYHYGMQDVLPIGKSVPRLAKRVIVRFGEAQNADLDWFTRLGISHEMKDKESAPQEVQREAWGRVTEWVRDELLSLEKITHPRGMDQSSHP